MLDLTRPLSETMLDWQIGAQCDLASMLQPLGDDLEPQLRIARLPQNANSPTDLDSWRDDAPLPSDAISQAHIFAEDPKVRTSTPISLFGQLNVSFDLDYAAAFIAGLHKALHETSDNKIWIVSSGLSVNKEYLIFFIVSLNRLAYEKHAHLNSLYFQDILLVGRYYFPRSLIEATVLQWCVDRGVDLIRNPSGMGYQVTREHDEILRMAGVLFTDGLVSRSFDGTNELFQCVDVLSALPYEGSVATGRIVFGPREDKSLVTGIRFKTPFSRTEYRGVRKVLELATDDYYLGLDSTGFYGIVQIGEYTLSSENVFSIRFRAHHEWVLCHTDTELMLVTNGLPKMPKPKISVEPCKSLLRGLFPSNIGSCQHVADLLLAASEKSHGTIIVICSDAGAEADRLKDQSVPIDPVRLSANNVERYTRIDGALILDPDANCYAIGVILDGRSSSRANRQRGARYNSAIKYIDSRVNPAIAVIVSEDGMVEVLHTEITPA